MSFNPVGWFEIYVQDMDRARKFYESVFQVQLQRLESPAIEMWAFPYLEGEKGIAGALVHMPGAPSGGSSIMVYFTCADCAVEGARAAAAGGKLEREKMSIGQYGHIVLIRDTEGNLVGLHSRD